MWNKSRGMNNLKALFMFQAVHHSLCAQERHGNLSNDYHPIALKYLAMKYFERLVMAHINTIIPDPLEPLQFAYRPNRSTDNTNSTTFHTALSHLDKRNTFVRMLFIDYSSVFNTIVPSMLITKLRFLVLNTSSATGSWTS
jgi:hypothetical protein